MPRTRVYRNGVLEAEGFPVADVSEYVVDPEATVWFDLCSPTADDLAAISAELGLHALAVEGAVHEHQRPKLDHYDSHLLVNAYAVWLDDDTGDLETCEVAAFVTANALVTVRNDERFDIDAVVARWDAAADLVEHGARAWGTDCQGHVDCGSRRWIWCPGSADVPVHPELPRLLVDIHPSPGASPGAGVDEDQPGRPGGRQIWAAHGADQGSWCSRRRWCSSRLRWCRPRV